MLIGSKFKLSQIKRKKSLLQNLNQNPIYNQPAVTKNLINSSKTLSTIPSVTKETPRPSLENKNNPIYKIGQINSDFTVKVNNTPLERVIKHKSLGVQIDESLLMTLTYIFHIKTL